jgi:hypothetical protein
MQMTQIKKIHADREKLLHKIFIITAISAKNASIELFNKANLSLTENQTI